MKVFGVFPKLFNAEPENLVTISGFLKQFQRSSLLFQKLPRRFEEVCMLDSNISNIRITLEHSSVVPKLYVNIKRICIAVQSVSENFLAFQGLSNAIQEKHK